ncbi:hypothetical protein [Staphylococcus americanisciuri]|uniref:Uncharacterized protein n=1 Tax=Staphylococcus americanisciuri TaxID=2973940 RepID=A0ABT2F2D2_9STAP|nr:hypothetical protein [Staphylococcus americanisciuri]MCS4486431.1 hypothetical protein [Staphylococcus americanisciuri]
MRRTQHSEVYPRVEKILDDGTIIAYDKYNQLNTDLNVNTLTDQQQHEVFGGILIQNSRQSQSHDYEYLRQKDAEIQKTNRKNKWLLVGLIIALLVIGLFVFKSCNQNDVDDTTNQETQTANNENNTQEEALQQKDAALQQQIKDTQDSIASNNNESQSKIDQLKQQIQDLRNSIDTKQADKVANQYEDTIDKLQEAENERQNGNLDKMQEQLDKVNSKLDEITQKINDWLNN